MKDTQERWNVEYDNDTGPNDDTFIEWFQVGPAKIQFRGAERDKAEYAARLMAASLELRDALREMLSILDSDKSVRLVMHGKAAQIRVGKAIQRSRAALAKAEGRKS